MALHTRQPAAQWMGARGLNLLIGVWLFISAFVWPHAVASRTNTWILGVLIVAFALIAMAQPAARWLNALAALWLFFSTLLSFHDTTATLWNNIIVAIVVFIVALVGNMGARDVTSIRRPINA
jgi:hypothetical protein